MESLGRLAFVLAFPEGEFVPFLSPVDGRVGRTIDQDRVVSGRRPDPKAVDEVIVSENTAERLDVEVGSRVRLGPSLRSRETCSRARAKIRRLVPF